MKQQKFFILIIFIAGAASILSVYHWVLSDEKEKQIPLTGKIVDEKKRTIASYPTTDEEKKTVLLASQKVNQLKKFRAKDSPIREGRLLSGNLGHHAYADESLKLPMQNRPARDWKDKALGRLLKHQRPTTKVILAPTDELILVIKGEGRYVEEVNVSYLFEDGYRTAFNALVDSQTGEILNTWGQVIHEQRKRKVTLTPTNL